MAQKESEHHKASANERLLEKKLQKSTETVEKLRKQLQAELDILGRLVPALSQAKETTKQSLDGLRAMLIAVHGAGADGDKNAPRHAPMELYSSRIQTRRLSSISTRVFDDESYQESESNSVAKEIGVVVANIDQFGPATNRFLESLAAKEIAGFLFSEMDVKLRSKFALQGFHSSVSAATQSELS